MVTAFVEQLSGTALAAASPRASGFSALMTLGDASLSHVGLL